MKALSVGQRLTGIIGLSVLVAVMLVGLGLYGLSASKDSIKTVYEDRMVPIRDLTGILSSMLESRAVLRTALSEVEIDTSGEEAVLAMNPEIASKSADAIEKNMKSIDGLWQRYMATYLAPEEKVLAEKFAKSLDKFESIGLKPAVVVLRINNYGATKRYDEQTYGLYTAAVVDMDALIKLQFDITHDEYNASVARYENVRMISLGALGVAIAILIWVGFVMARSITRALGGEPEVINETATRIAAGNLSVLVPLRVNDRSSAMAAMSALQDKIKLLVADASMLSQAAVSGRLATRADATQHQGDFRKVVEGVNATLDSVIGPLNVAANYVDRISKGDIPAQDYRCLQR